MRLAKTPLSLIVIAALLSIPALSAAQEPVRSFDQLKTRLKPGDTIWITDAQGREVKGRITSLSPESLALNAKGAPVFSATDVTTIRLRESDSLRNGALIGLAIGGGLAAAGCVAESGYEDSFCPAYILLYPAMGLGIAVGIDALIPGKKLIACRAPGAGGANHARFSIAPVVTPRTKGVAICFAF